MKQLFPKEIINSTVEVHQFRHKTRSKIIYTIILLSLIVMLISLPLIKVSVYSTSSGIIKPDKERIILKNITNGKVVFSNLLNNKKVIKGDTLLVINNNSLQRQLTQNKYQIEELKSFVTDLNILLQERHNKKLSSSKFIQEDAFFKQKLNELETRYRKIREDYNRNTHLFEKGVIAKITLNSSKLEYDLSLNAIHQLKKQQYNTWQSQLISYKNQLKELESTQIRLEENKDLSVVKAPISGTLLNVQGIEKGSFVTIGTQLAQLSPNANLIVECYVNPTDIGLLKKQNIVNFQVGAFNYNQWGLATGKIIDIANDVQLINSMPMFRVLCSLDQTYLELKNGFKGKLKKGMTLNARFEITKRTLFNLLYDKADDWLNPSQKVTSA